MKSSPFPLRYPGSRIRRYPPLLSGALHASHGLFRTQLRDLAATIDALDCDTIIAANSVDLTRLITLSRPCCRVRYDLEEINRPDLADVMLLFLHDHAERLKSS